MMRVWCRLSAEVIVLSMILVAGCDSSSAMRNPGPLFRFAVLADTQYGPHPDSRDPGQPRFYRHSLEALDQCVEELNARPPAFVAQLGDIIEGYAVTPENQRKSLADMQTVLARFNRLTCPRMNVLGNHCLLAGRAEAQQALGLERGYYSWSRPEAPAWVFVALDAVGLGTPHGDAQLRWFEQTLAQAQAGGKRVIVFCHFPLVEGFRRHGPLPGAAAVTRIVQKHPSVAAWFAGHDHSGQHAYVHGLHQVTVEAMVENPRAAAYGVVDVYKDRMVYHSRGAQPSVIMYLDH